MSDFRYAKNKSRGMKRILVVEDNVFNQKLFEFILKSKYEVEVVNNGVEAIGTLNKKEFDLVLMDYAMPFMNGAEAILKVRNAENRIKNIPIVMITTNILEEERAYCLKCGANEYLLKPILREELIKVIESYLV